MVVQADRARAIGRRFLDSSTKPAAAWPPTSSAQRPADLLEGTRLDEPTAQPRPPLFTHYCEDRDIDTGAPSPTSSIHGATAPKIPAAQAARAALPCTKPPPNTRPPPNPPRRIPLARNRRHFRALDRRPPPTCPTSTQPLQVTLSESLAVGTMARRFSTKSRRLIPYHFKSSPSKSSAYIYE